tara:strand:- start:643 stop:792 length:150 start_codon:yes stop_codon:yes gene_type:complete
MMDIVVKEVLIATFRVVVLVLTCLVVAVFNICCGIGMHYVIVLGPKQLL